MVRRVPVILALYLCVSAQGMKHIIALLLLAPVVASAANYECQPLTTCTLPPLTSGTLSVGPNGAAGQGNARWSASGPGYSTSGGSGALQGVGQGWPLPPGAGTIYLGDDLDGYLSMGLAINGVG